MSWKKMIFGEKMPDKDDPKYKERYEREVAAGRKAAQAAETRQRRQGACNASPASTPSGFSPLCSALC